MAQNIHMQRDLQYMKKKDLIDFSSLYFVALLFYWGEIIGEMITGGNCFFFHLAMLLSCAT